MAKKTIETYCNESCNQPFTIKQMKTSKLHKGIEKTYFNCPHCKHEYTCFYTNKDIRKLQSEMRALHRKMKWSNENELEKLEQDEARLKEFIAHSMASVKQEAEQHEQ